MKDKDKKKSPYAGMTSAQKVVAMEGEIKDLKDRQKNYGKIDRSIPFAPVTPEMRGPDAYLFTKAGRQITDRNKTLGRVKMQAARAAAAARKKKK